MDVLRLHTIAESAHRVLNPLTAEQLATLGDALRMPSGTTVLDLACGKGELLCTWSRDHGVTGTGVDVNPPFVAAARARAEELGVASAVRFVESDATEFVVDPPVDVASCLGATWIGAGVEGTLDLLERSLRPGGTALVGECFWREVPPDEAAVHGSGAAHVDDFSTLPGLVERVQRHGWDVVEMVLADEHSWDRYVAARWTTMRRFLDEHPDDPDAGAVRAELDAEPVRYTRYQRRHLGWGVLVLRRRPT